MKKIISAALAAAATLSVSAVAFAEQGADIAETESTKVASVTDVTVVKEAKAADVLTAIAAKDSSLKDVTVDQLATITFDSDMPYAIMVDGVALAKETSDAPADDTDAPATRAEADRTPGVTIVTGDNIKKFTIDAAEDIVFTSIVVTYEAAAENPGDNKPTGIALAVAPAALAAAFVGVAAVVSKKKKG